MTAVIRSMLDVHVENYQDKFLLHQSYFEQKEEVCVIYNFNRRHQKVELQLVTVLRHQYFCGDK